MTLLLLMGMLRMRRRMLLMRMMFIGRPALLLHIIKLLELFNRRQVESRRGTPSLAILQMVHRHRRGRRIMRKSRIGRRRRLASGGRSTRRHRIKDLRVRSSLNLTLALVLRLRLAGSTGCCISDSSIGTDVAA